MEYQVVEGISKAELEERVREWLGQGWYPIGGVAFVQQLCDAEKNSHDNSSTLYDAGFAYVQAMIKPALLPEDHR